MNKHVNKQANKFQKLLANFNVISHESMGKWRYKYFLHLHQVSKREPSLWFHILVINSFGILACYRLSFTTQEHQPELVWQILTCVSLILVSQLFLGYRDSQFPNGNLQIHLYRDLEDKGLYQNLPESMVVGKVRIEVFSSQCR